MWYGPATANERESWEQSTSLYSQGFSPGNTCLLLHLWAFNSTPTLGLCKNTQRNQLMVGVVAGAGMALAGSARLWACDEHIRAAGRQWWGSPHQASHLMEDGKLQKARKGMDRNRIFPSKAHLQKPPPLSGNNTFCYNLSKASINPLVSGPCDPSTSGPRAREQAS